jgi:DNA-binding response OmpR family regulator
LVIDDDKAITQMLLDYYEGKGETCTVYNKGTEGLKAMRNDSFDVVLLDLNMPDFSGFDLLRTFAYRGLLKQKNAIIITAMDIPPEQEKQMINAGVVGIIRKPFSLSSLDKAVNRFRK